MFDTLKLIYTQDEALELVSRYEEVYKEKIKELEEENKELKEKYDGLWKIYTSEANELKELNKQMQENYDNLNDSYSEILGENEKLKEKIKGLEERLDNKEKLNEEYRKQLGIKPFNYSE